MVDGFSRVVPMHKKRALNVASDISAEIATADFALVKQSAPLSEITHPALWPTSWEWRACLLAFLISISSVPANAQSVQVNGKFGYLSEYELTASVVAKTTDENGEFSGPMIVRHVGLCTHDGAVQKTGKLD